MAAKYQRKEDFPERTHRRIKAISKAFNIPEEELWEDLFRIGKDIDAEKSKPTSPEETLFTFTLPKNK